METSEYLSTVTSVHEEARRRGLFFQTCTDQSLSGRAVTLGDRRVTSFSSCSYLGLERHPRLVAAVHDAVDRYGTQFSSSRGYLSAPGYDLLEGRLSTLFGGHALVTSSTTVAHQIALPVLATEKDAIVLDHQVHHSVHMAATLCRAGGTTVELVKHGELERAEEVVARLARKARTVWFAIDGVFSMYGDLAPVGLLHRLLAVAPNVRLYVDDAHGMSWAGTHGRGSFLSRMPLTERMVVATSLNKAFSAAGGCLVFPTAEEREQVRVGGGPMVFSGPVQPPMLGAALASAEVHLSPEIEHLQRALAERTTLANRALREAGMPALVENESPIFFLRVGLPRVAFKVAERMLHDGFYVNVSAYPSVPMKRAGIRLTLTAAHELSAIEEAISRLAVHVPAALAEEGVSDAELARLFERALPTESRPRAERIPSFEPGAAANDTRARTSSLPAGRLSAGTPSAVVVELHRTIHEVDRDLWDACLGTAAACSWEAMAMAERVFRGQARPEHDWRFLYVIVRDRAGKPVAATFFTTALAKDDMLMRDAVSRAVEARRRDDPYFLTSRVVSMGSVLSEGNHLFLDRSGPWEEALQAVLEAGAAEYEANEAGALVLRDLPGSDPEVDRLALDAGLVKVPMLDSHHLEVRWTDDAGYLAGVGGRSRRRKQLRELMAGSVDYEARVATAGSLDAAAVAHLYGLYRAVADKKLKLNVFALPENLIPAMTASPAWDVVTLHLDPARGDPADGAPVAWFGAHHHGDAYAPFLCGLDYRYVQSHGAYRQMLLQIVRRAAALGARSVHLGMDADTEKLRFGTTVRASCIYVQARDHYNGALLREIVAEVGVERPALAS